LTKCQSRLSPEELKAKFYRHKTDLEFVIKSIERDKKLASIFSYEWTPVGRLPTEDKAYHDIFIKLKNADIKHFSVHPNPYPKGTKWYYLETSWPNDYLIVLSYNAYDTSETTKGYYSKDEVNNETWGLGDNWYMFRWVKDRPYKQ
jgi:hypothetical protein